MPANIHGGRGKKKGSIVQYFRKHYEYLDTLKDTRGVDINEMGHGVLREASSPENDRLRKYFDEERNETISRSSKKIVNNNNEVVAFDDL